MTERCNCDVCRYLRLEEAADKLCEAAKTVCKTIDDLPIDDYSVAGMQRMFQKPLDDALNAYEKAKEQGDDA